MGDVANSQNTALLPRAGYYPVLDALRFLMAFWVVVSHFGMMPLFGDFHTGTGLWLLFKHAWSTVVFGTPAVIVFFVISGFCIHMPFRGGGKIDVGRYYLRRYTRILIPVAAALAVYRVFGMRMVFWGEHSVLWDSPLWSLACEEIYYAQYPLLRWLRNRLGWKFLLPPSFVLSILLASQHPHSMRWQPFGPFAVAMMLLPVWLLGCVLAEQAESLSAAGSWRSIWLWRFAAWLGCWTSEMLHFKLGVPFTQTMVWFGVLAYFWVRQELAHGKARSPNRYLVAAGAWSYSLYLVHVQGGGVVLYLHLPSMGKLPDWFLIMSSTLVFAYLFYLLVERPSHRLARTIKVRGARNAVDRVKETAVAPAPADVPVEQNSLAKEAIGS